MYILIHTGNVSAINDTFIYSNLKLFCFFLKKKYRSNSFPLGGVLQQNEYDKKKNIYRFSLLLL